MDNGDTEHIHRNVIAYLDLVADIMAGELEFRRSDEASGPVSTERDFSFATELLTSVRRWLNDQDISEAIREERARFAAGKGAAPVIAKLDEAELAAHPARRADGARSRG